jgi:hypothetical protein
MLLLAVPHAAVPVLIDILSPVLVHLGVERLPADILFFLFFAVFEFERADLR